MVWSTKNTYGEHTREELIQMCKVRQLPVTGTKLKLCNVLGSYDVAHPFRFLSLPAEIRNMIYQYVAVTPLEGTDERVQASLDVKRRNEKKNSPKPPKTPSAKPTTTPLSITESPLHGSPHMMSLTPGLMCVNRQIRTEFTPLYYANHTFSCNLFHPDAAPTYGTNTKTNANGISTTVTTTTTSNPVGDWLESLGERRKYIRHLRFHVDPYTADTSCIVALNAKLRENDDSVTTVEYIAKRKGGTCAKSTTPTITPTTNTAAAAAALRGRKGSDALFHLQLVAIQYPSRSRKESAKPVLVDDGPGKTATLTFGPGNGFFGPKA